MINNLFIPFSFNVLCVYIFQFIIFNVFFFSYTKGQNYIFTKYVFCLTIFLTFYTINPISQTQLENNYLDPARLFRLVFLTFILIFSVINIKYIDIKFIQNTSIIFYFLFIIFAITSSGYSSNKLVSLYKSVELFVDIIFIFYISTLIRNINDCKQYFDLIYLCFFFLCITALINIVIFPQYALPWSRSDIFQFRLRGALPLINTNELSEMASVLASMVIFRISLSGKLSLVNFTIFIVSILVLILGCSRTSIISFLLILFLFFLYLKKIKYIILLVPIFVIFFCFGFSEYFTAYILRGESANSISKLGGRMAIWPMYWDYFLQSPFFGHGFYTAFRFFDQNLAAKYGLVTETANTTDNTYLEILLGVGGLGLFFIIISLIGSFICIVKIKVFQQLCMQLKIELFSILIIIVIRSLTGPTFSQHNFNSIMYIFICFTSCKILYFSKNYILHESY